MALIRYSALINDVRGSIGNGTFQRSQGGAMVRNKPVPGYRNSQFTVNVRMYLPQVVFAWRNLSSAEKLQWQYFLTYSPDFMRKSPKTILSAYSLFVKYNCIRLMSGFSIVTTITIAVPNLSPTRPSMALDSGSLVMDIGQPIPGVDLYYQIKATRPSLNRHSKSLNDFRVIKKFDGPNQTFDISDEYIAAWGAIPTSGQWVRYMLTFFHATQPFIYSPIENINSF